MCVEVCTANVKGSSVSLCWMLATVGVRTGESEISLVFGNDGSEVLPHAHKTITVSLHGYLHVSQTSTVILFGRASKFRVFLFQTQFLNIYFSLGVKSEDRTVFSSTVNIA